MNINVARYNAEMNPIDRLLVESPSAARLRSQILVKQAVPDFSKIALFGAGTMGRSTLGRLRAVGVEPKAFIDDTPDKQGTFIEGVPIYSRAEARNAVGLDAVIIVTILNPNLTYLKARDLLVETGLKNVSMMMLGWAFPDLFGDILNTAPPELIVGHRADILRCREIWADEKSRRVFDDQMNWRLTLDFNFLPEACLNEIYFPLDIDLDLSKQISFVDAGAYDGDSCEQFMRYTHGQFKQILAIEPDPSSYSRLEQSLARYAGEGRARCFNMGVGGEYATLKFLATGDMSAALDQAGNISVEVKPLEFFLSEDNDPAYVKFDIEGAEWQALVAAQALIAQRRPKLAVSVYHDAQDLWRIPLLIRDCLPESKLYLRAHGVDGTDVVLYAV